MSEFIDYYEILKIKINATPKEIKNAYRNLARELHPDKNLNDPNANEKFSRLANAYENLIDQKKRINYDEKMKAKLQRKVENQKRTDEQKIMKDKLEEKEKEAKEMKHSFVTPKDVLLFKLQKIREENNEIIEMLKLSKNKINVIDVDDNIKDEHYYMNENEFYLYEKNILNSLKQM